MQAQGRLGCEEDEGGVTERREAGGGLTGGFTSTGSKHDINKTSECVPAAKARDADGRAAVPSRSHGFGWRVAEGGREEGSEEGAWFPAAAPPLPVDIYSSSKKKELPGP